MLTDPRSTRRGLLTGAAALAAYAALPTRPAEADLLLTGAGKKSSTASFTTFDPSNSAPNATLTGGNLVVTSVPGNYGISRSIASITGTKRFEITLTNYGTAWRAGIVNGSFAITLSTMGDDANSVALMVSGGNWVLRYNGSDTDVTALGFTFTTNDVVGFEVDQTTSQLWLARSGSNYPARPTGKTIPSGTLYAAVQVGPQDTAYTANFGASAWATTPTTSGYVGF